MADVREQLAALLGQKSRFYQPQQATSPGPVVPPAASAGSSRDFLARALAPRAAPNSVGSGIYDASKSIANAMVARGEREKSEADQAKLVGQYEQLRNVLTQGETVPGGAAQAAGVAAVPGGMSNAQQTKPGAYGADSPTVALANALSPSDPKAAMQIFASDIAARRAAELKAAAEARKYNRDLARDKFKSDLGRRPDTAEVNRQKIARHAAEAGYEYGPDGSLRPIPGGPQDPRALAKVRKMEKDAEYDAKFEAAFPKVRGQIESGYKEFSNLEPVIDRAIENTNAWTAGLFGKKLSEISGTPAADLRNDLETIRANLGFSKLQQMRANSPTGGALGQVSEMENRLLQSVNRALQNEQSPGRLKSNLTDVKRDLAEYQQHLVDVFKQDYGKFLGPEWQPPVSPNAAGPAETPALTGKTKSGVGYTYEGP